MKRLLTTAAFIWGVWTLVGLATGTNGYLLSAGSQRPPALGQTLYRALVEHWIWAALTPAILWVSARLPYSRESAPRVFLSHCVFFLVISLFHSFIANQIGIPFRYAVSHFQGS